MPLAPFGIQISLRIDPLTVRLTLSVLAYLFAKLAWGVEVEVLPRR